MPGWRSADALAQLTLLEPPLLDCAERQFQAHVEALLSAYGWTWYHAHTPERDHPGWFDLVAVRGDAEAATSFYAELKRTRGRTDRNQRHWALLMRAAGHTVYEWRPGDWQEIVRVVTVPASATVAVPPWQDRRQQEVWDDVTRTGRQGATAPRTRTRTAKSPPTNTKPPAVATQRVT